MRKLHCMLVLLLFCSFNLFGQTAARTTIKGVICDTAGITLPSAMVMLLSAKDSALVNFTQADEKGVFEFRNVKNSGYLLKIQHMSFLPYQNILPVSATELTDLGRIQLKMISKMLLEVVIKAARAPLKFRGDTIEYDASSFKVPPGSTVEDLLRRLPGIDVDVDGNIKAQGKNVNRLYVEGRTFFGNDPKYATKNLGAEVISKVQFFDEKSEQSKLTGIDDGVKDTKAMNLSLKEEFKQGAFGKLTAAIGDQKRWALKGNYNRFDKKQQLSFIGFGNNINQTGVSWDDYSEFKGQSYSNYDNGDFGFGGQRYSTDYGGLTGSFNGQGLSDNSGGGVNYNLDNKKTKFNSSYSYNQTTRNLSQSSNTETFLDTTSFKAVSTSQNRNFRGNHSLGLYVEHIVDTANTITAKANINFTTSTGNSSGLSVYSDANNLMNRMLTTTSDNNSNSWNINSAVIYRLRLKKRGANFAVSGGLNSVKYNALDKPFSISRFFDAKTITDQIRELNTNNNNNNTQFKAGMLLTEPLSKKFYVEGFYNFSTTNTVQDKLTQNAAMQNIRIDTLTGYYSDMQMFNRIGGTFRYSNKGLNASIGLAGQQVQLQGNYSMRIDMPDLKDPVNKSYFNLVPNISISYQATKTASLNASFTKNVNMPSMSQLMPIFTISPIYIYQSNPDLQPSQSQSYSFNFQTYSQANMSSLYLSFNYRETKNTITSTQDITMVDKVGMQTVIGYVNMNGSDNSKSINAQYSFPIIKTKLTLSVSGNLNFGMTPTLINSVKNVSKNTWTSLQTSLNLTLTQKILFSLSGNISNNDIHMSINKNLDQRVKNWSSSSSVKWQFATKSYFESTFNYSVYKNASFGFNRNVPLLNASIRQIVGKTNRIELRLAAFDLFNKNQSISQFVAQNAVISSTANTLARYFMLSLSYNIKGFDLKSTSRQF